MGRRHAALVEEEDEEEEHSRRRLNLLANQQRPGPSMTEGFLVILIKASCSTPSSI